MNLNKSLIQTFILGMALAGGTLADGASPVYYQVSTGENYEHSSWHTAASMAAFKKLKKDIYDSYTIEPQKHGGTQVCRTCSSPSGDWVAYLRYIYNPSGQLTNIYIDYRTFLGWDPAMEDAALTRCERIYQVSAKGHLLRKSEKITDVETGKLVKRTFPWPEIPHWMKLSDLPVAPKVKDKSQKK